MGLLRHQMGCVQSRLAVRDRRGDPVQEILRANAQWLIAVVVWRLKFYGALDVGMAG
jgi:hypothetical protein